MDNYYDKRKCVGELLQRIGNHNAVILYMKYNKMYV